MRGTKNISLRLTAEEYCAFDMICREKGYSKTGKIREFIRGLIKEELDTALISDQEWKRIEYGIKEIERGEYIPFEQLKQEVQNSSVADNKSIKYGKNKHPLPSDNRTNKNT
jgi:hypothetical protein